MLKKIHGFFKNHYHTRYHGVYRHAKQLFVFDLALLGLALIIMAGGLYLAFWKPAPRHFANLNLLLGGGRIVSGQNVTISIEYTNTSKTTLHDPILAVHTPAGFVLEKSITTQKNLSEDSTIHLPDLLPGSRGTAQVTGRLFSEPGAEDRVVGILTFRPDSEPAITQETFTLNFSLPDSVLRSNLVMPSSTYPGSTVPVTYRLENTGDKAVENISLEGAYGPEFLTANDLELFSLEPGASKAVTTTITVPNSGTQFSLGVTPRVEVNGYLINQKKSFATALIFDPKVSLEVTLQDSLKYASVEETVPITIRWKNNGTYKIESQTLELSFTNGVVDVSASAKLNGISQKDGKLIITKKEHTALAEGRPGSGDSINLNLKLLSTFNLDGQENTNLEITPAMVGVLSNVPNQQFTVTDGTVSIPLATELNWQAAARYYTDDGEQLGRGPLPPRIGQTTRYWVLFDVYNTTNLVSGLNFVAHLPPGVTFTGKQSVTLGTKLNYDETTRTVSWSYAQMPANSQTGLYFEVSVTPTANQAGQNIKLIQDASFTAKDDVVGKPFSLNINGITNVLPTSDKGSRSGAIVR